MMMGEVADWLDLNGRDVNWISPTRRLRKLVPLPEALISQLSASRSSTPTVVEPTEHPYIFLHFIALQLLASCYTLLPSSSAESLPLCGQKLPELATSLKLHAQYRFSPAAGHHAPCPSEASPWPGLYYGPCLEERVAEQVSKKRRIQKHLRETSSSRSEEPCPSGGTDKREGSDGPTYPQIHDERRASISSSSSSSTSGQGLLSRWICQPSFSKAPRRRPNRLFLDNIFSTPTGRKSIYPHRHQSDNITQTRRSPAKNITSFLHTRQRIPPTLLLRRTQSVPRRADNIVSPFPPYSVLNLRRNNSTPTIRSPPQYPYEIPEIRHTSALTTSPLQADGRGEYLTAKEFLDETRLSPAHALLVNHTTHSSPGLLAPLSSEDAIITTFQTKPSRYFGKASINTMPQEDSMMEKLDWESQQNSAHGTNDVGSAVEEPWSKDSVDKLDKRKSMLVRTPDLCPVFSRRSFRNNGEEIGDCNQDSDSVVEVATFGEFHHNA
ncbi:uncharacterized protein BDR25DRAFT_308742 [Lindgomyces ingoldianus]|uniref:Uncharacterized protein n=1 Tax=Lindgomyces ingoldianus TaxID=673940 RepID=A0ACB6RGJ9_9PLEO|nr:uncharacterized protein BDR25DRAFT_308742 [Lindgomyces ingoldianus]KAF2477893.1 hypothetical protein BDR25DRAFT_308742 [Lindgomyces ingoldianus]